MYNFDIDKLLVLLTPTFLRKPKVVAWLRALATPLNQLLYQFQQARETTVFR